MINRSSQTTEQNSPQATMESKAQLLIDGFGTIPLTKDLLRYGPDFDDKDKCYRYGYLGREAENIDIPIAPQDVGVVSRLYAKVGWNERLRQWAILPLKLPLKEGDPFIQHNSTTLRKSEWSVLQDGDVLYFGQVRATFSMQPHAQENAAASSHSLQTERLGKIRISVQRQRRSVESIYGDLEGLWRDITSVQEKNSIKEEGVRWISEELGPTFTRIIRKAFSPSYFDVTFVHPYSRKLLYDNFGDLRGCRLSGVYQGERQIKQKQGNFLYKKSNDTNERLPSFLGGVLEQKLGTQSLCFGHVLIIAGDVDFLEPDHFLLRFLFDTCGYLLNQALVRLPSHRTLWGSFVMEEEEEGKQELVCLSSQSVLEPVSWDEMPSDALQGIQERHLLDLVRERCSDNMPAEGAKPALPLALSECSDLTAFPLVIEMLRDLGSVSKVAEAFGATEKTVYNYLDRVLFLLGKVLFIDLLKARNSAGKNALEALERYLTKR